MGRARILAEFRVGGRGGRVARVGLGRYAAGMLIRHGVVVLGVLVAACSSDVRSEGASGSGAATSATSSTSSASGGSGGSTTSASGGSSGAVTCNPSGVLCDALPPACVPGEVPAVQGSCWGDCVPILECATEPNCDNCEAGFCAEYVAFTTEYRCVLPNLMCSALACGCLAPYFCVSPYDGCSETMGPADVCCGCPTC